MRHQAGLALVVAGALACGCSSGGTGPATGTLPLRTITDLDLPGNTSRFDYASLDTTRHRLYVSHLGASQIVVIDTHGPTVERTLDNVASVHGVLAVPVLIRAADSLSRFHSDSLGLGLVRKMGGDTLFSLRIRWKARCQP